MGICYLVSIFFIFFFFCFVIGTRLSPNTFGKDLNNGPWQESYKASAFWQQIITMNMGKTNIAGHHGANVEAMIIYETKWVI